MNWRYMIGKSLDECYLSVLSLPWFPLTNAVAFGRVWPFDIIRFFGSREIKTVFDVGANVGQTALHVRRFLPQTTIHSFEPVPTTCEELRRNTVRYPNIKVHSLALSDTNGETEIYVTDDSQLSSLEPRDDQAAVRVSIQKLDDFCTEHDIKEIDVLKMDVEGHELGVIKGAHHMLTSGRIRFVYGEIGFGAHDKGHTPFPKFHATMMELGFEFSGLYEEWRDPSNRYRYEFANAMYWNPAFRSEKARLSD